MTHYEFTTKHKPPQPCNAAHMTFGDRCLNCGYDGRMHYECITVDPDTCLCELLDLARQLIANKDTRGHDTTHDADIGYEIAQLVLNLDKRITTGGPLPTRWDVQ